MSSEEFLANIFLKLGNETLSLLVLNESKLLSLLFLPNRLGVGLDFTSSFLPLAPLSKDVDFLSPKDSRTLANLPLSIRI